MPLNRKRQLRAIGQAKGEGLAQHPTLTDPLESVFALCLRYKVLPHQALSMDGELFQLFAEWQSGHDRGENIRAKRRK